MHDAFRGDIRPVAVFASLAFLAGCGSGGGTSSPAVAPAATSNANLGGIGISFSIPTAAPIVAKPGSFIFAHAGSSQSATLTELAYGGGFFPSSSNAGVAAANVVRDSLGNYILTVTAVGPGSATIVIRSDNGGTGSVPVAVTAP